MAGGLCYLVAGGKWNAVVLTVGPRRDFAARKCEISHVLVRNDPKTVGWVFGTFVLSRQVFVGNVCDDDSVDLQSYIVRIGVKRPPCTPGFQTLTRYDWRILG